MTTDTKTAHTPGPWHFFPQKGYFPRVYIGGPVPESAELRGPYISVNNAEPAADMDVHEANARLIAAAPELLEALEALAAVCEKQPRISKACPDPRSPLGLARTAIAKATGRSTLTGGSDA